MTGKTLVLDSSGQRSRPSLVWTFECCKNISTLYFQLYQSNLNFVILQSIWSPKSLKSFFFFSGSVSWRCSLQFGKLYLATWTKIWLNFVCCTGDKVLHQNKRVQWLLSPPIISRALLGVVAPLIVFVCAILHNLQISGPRFMLCAPLCLASPHPPEPKKFFVIYFHLSTLQCKLQQNGLFQCNWIYEKCMWLPLSAVKCICRIIITIITCHTCSTYMNYSIDARVCTLCAALHLEEVCLWVCVCVWRGERARTRTPRIMQHSSVLKWYWPAAIHDGLQS